MSYIARRALSTLIPPKIASPSAIGGAQDAVRMQRVVNFYEKLPRGPAPKRQPKGPLEWYQHRYMGENPSAMPLLHLIGGITLLGYSFNYYFHLRHHKNNAH
ncbi:mitochondrial F1F0 ATP synthase subunit F Atp17 [Viridothelium virens]|uniref:Mitochondrial F1F0 ATP synthase subunit F Atp17 n=1 Tax=Viridothelium virens TaxID=1048519 RepID=A0A6A6HPY5_VIRVR|nr:mitochondrial F1F0 ATP synthase subunit F Atp17 [Viridothelium virens]